MNVKKLASFALTFLLAITAVGCGEYKSAPSVNTGAGSGSGSGTGGGGGSGVFQNPSTVSLYKFVNGKRVPFAGVGDVEAIWTGEGAVKTAKFDASGLATVDGLDGNYKVTLSGLPDGYTYNPNAHETTNDARNIEIDLYEVIIPSGGGTHMYSDFIRLNDDTKDAVNPYVYRVTIDSEADRVHCQFSPPRSGMYSVESWADITREMIDPNVDVYTGSFAAKYFNKVLEDGGLAGVTGFTTNFKHEVKIAADEVGHDFSFAIWGTSKNGKYPITIDFVVQCDGEWVRKDVESVMMTHEELRVQKEYDSTKYTVVQASVDPKTRRDTRIFQSVVKEADPSDPDTKITRELYKFNPDTGYYHVYNAELYQGGYTETYADGTKATFAAGFGPILYMEINAGRGADLDPFILDYQGTPMGFSNIEMPGNKSLTVSQGTENYKMFIEGYAALESNGHVWVSGLTSAERSEYRKYTGYANACNSRGVYGVTEELKQFAQKFCISQELFADGEGFAEGAGYDALDDDQWLFACVYYQNNTTD